MTPICFPTISFKSTLLKTVGIFFLLCVLITTATATQALAQTQAQAQPAIPLNAVGFTITPPTAYIRVKPGTQTTHTITLENISSRALTIQPKIVDFATDGKTGTPILQNFSTFPYLRFQDGRTLDASFDPVELQPAQKAQLTLLIGVPPNAEEKEWPLTVLFAAQNTTVGIPDDAALLQATLGSNMIVLISTEDELTRTLSMKDAGASLFADSLRPLTVKPVLQNNHYAATVASGSAILKNWQGTSIATQKYYPDVILGYSSREVQAQGAANGAKSLPERVPITFKPAFFLGLYTISYTMDTPDGSTQELATATVIALPFLGLLVVFGMAILGTAFWFIQKPNRY